MLEVLESALRFEDPEYLCLLAAPAIPIHRSGWCSSAPCSARGSRRRCTPSSLPTRASSSRSSTPYARPACARGERLVVCELPHDAPFDVTAVALVASGYREEGRIDDFVRDGVALRLLVWRPDARSTS